MQGLLLKSYLTDLSIDQQYNYLIVSNNNYLIVDNLLATMTRLVTQFV